MAMFWCGFLTGATLAVVSGVVFEWLYPRRVTGPKLRILPCEQCGREYFVRADATRLVKCQECMLVDHFMGTKNQNERGN